MRFDDLLKSGRIRKEKKSQREVDRALERARRDLDTARKILADDWDWGFAVAYNAVLQASRAFMFSKGYRPSSTNGHKNTFAFMSRALGDEFAGMISYFDKMRNKRNQAIYDVAGMITKTEACALYKQAVAYVELVESWLRID